MIECFCAVNAQAKVSAGENASSSLFCHADNAVVVSVFSAVDLV